MKSFILSQCAIATVILFASCSNTNQHNEQSGNDTTSSPDMTNVTSVKPSLANVDTMLSKQVQGIYTFYLEIQSALAGDKSDDASNAAARLTLLMNGYKNDTLPQDQKQAYESHANEIKETAAKIQTTKEIAMQRAAFQQLSAHVFELLKSFGSETPVYQTFCPMAFDNKGANWLSDKTAIRNPYFGERMLECGEVVTIIKK